MALRRTLAGLGVLALAVLALGDSRNAPLNPLASLVRPDGATHASVQEAYGNLPLRFEANQGQTDPQVKFFSRGSGYTLFLTPEGAVLALRKPAAPDANQQTVLRMQLLGANSEPLITGLDELPGKSNYFIGNDPSKWRTNVPSYAGVEYRDVYTGIDLVYYGNQRHLEYDFVVGPGADPRAIRLAFEGAEKLSLDDQGNLIVQVDGGEVVQRAPTIYQEKDGVKQAIPGGYLLRGEHEVAFQVAAYDTSRALVIDPVLAYSTYLGGSHLERASDIAVDGEGNAYITGTTRSINFPTTAAALKPSRPPPLTPTPTATLEPVVATPTPIATPTPSPSEPPEANSIAFVTKLNATGSDLVYSTYLGGNRGSGGTGIAVDSEGNAYVTGITGSDDFPTTEGAFQTTCNFGFTFDSCADAFVAKLNAAGSSLIYSTYLGGGAYDQSSDIALDTSGNAYITGATNFGIPLFPVTAGAFQTTFGGGVVAFVTKLNSTGTALFYSTYLGGGHEDRGNSIAVDADGNAYVTGSTTQPFPTTEGAFQTTSTACNGCTDAFVSKLNPSGSALVYSTYLGTFRQDVGSGIAVDADGNAYVVGKAGHFTFPTTEGAFRTTSGGLFLTKLNTGGSALVYSTFLGVSAPVPPIPSVHVALDAEGNAYLTGRTFSGDIPTVDPFQSGFGGGFPWGDAFVMKMNAEGSALLYSSYLGGSDNEISFGIAVDGSGIAYVTGETASPDFPTTEGAFQRTYAGNDDAFVAKIADLAPVGGFQTPLGTTRSASGNARLTAVLVAAITAGVLALGGAAWYARRRRG